MLLRGTEALISRVLIGHRMGDCDDFSRAETELKS